MTWRGHYRLYGLVREQTRARGATRSIALEVATLADSRTGETTASIRRLVTLSGFSRQTVARALAELVDEKRLGELAVVDSRRGLTRVYRFRVELWGGTKTGPPSGAESRTPGGAESRTPPNGALAGDQATTGTGIRPHLVGNWPTGVLPPNSPARPIEKREERTRDNDSYESARPAGRASDLLTETTSPNGSSPPGAGALAHRDLVAKAREALACLPQPSPPRWAALERVLRGGGWTDADGDAMAWLERRTASELASITLSARAELGMSEAAADPGYVLDLPLSSPTEETTS